MVPTKDKAKRFARLGPAVRQKRTKEGISQKDLAEKVGLTSKTIRNAETAMKVNYDIAVKICEELGLTFEDVKTFDSNNLSVYAGELDYSSLDPAPKFYLVSKPKDKDLLAQELTKKFLGAHFQILGQPSDDVIDLLEELGSELEKGRNRYKHRSLEEAIEANKEEKTIRGIVDKLYSLEVRFFGTTLESWFNGSYLQKSIFFVASSNINYAYSLAYGLHPRSQSSRINFSEFPIEVSDADSLEQGLEFFSLGGEDADDADEEQSDDIPF